VPNFLQIHFNFVVFYIIILKEGGDIMGQHQINIIDKNFYIKFKKEYNRISEKLNNSKMEVV
jgi:hypothetical protein